MARLESADFLGGVIEGFYGPPWTPIERLEIFESMAGWGLNTYLYGPKDDLKHRAIWREPYTAEEAGTIGEMIRACQARGLRFIYAIGPGLDIRYTGDADLGHLVRRFEQLHALGCSDFAVCFDDIPDRLEPADRERFGTFASAQCHVANAVFRWTRDRGLRGRFLFCPTPYCDRMAERELGGARYLETVGRELLPEIDVFWTGPEIISRDVTPANAAAWEQRLRRRPLLWDNLHANDYDGRRFYCGPYDGRPPGLLPRVTGILCNPNTEFPLNYVPLRTFAAFLDRHLPWSKPHLPLLPDGSAWEPRAAYLAALREWWPRFATVGAPIEFEDLVLLGDAYYLPYEDGPAATALFQRVRILLGAAPEAWGEDVTAVRELAARLRTTCARIVDVRHRPLFYALSRRVWELREELELLDRYLQFRLAGSGAVAGHFDFHLPGTYRGSLVARLQQLLVPQPDGTFVTAATPARSEA